MALTPQQMDSIILAAIRKHAKGKTSNLYQRVKARRERDEQAKRERATAPSQPPKQTPPK